MLKTSVIVPLIPEHDRDLYKLISYLKTQENAIAELLICRSETPDKKHASLLRKYRRWGDKLGVSFKIELSSTPNVAYDGTNRNRGLVVAKSDIIVCLDADDMYSKSMFKSILQTFESTNCDAILHNFTYEAEELALDLGILPETLVLSYPEEADVLDFDVPIIALGTEVKPMIHHAHISLRRSRVNELFLDIFPGADTEFCKRLIRNGKTVVFLNQKLSFWNRKRSLRYKIRLAKKKLGLKK